MEERRAPSLTSSPETLSRRESGDDEPPSKRQRLLDGQSSPHSLPDFKPGALIRIRMRNFMTYDDITYNFGPALNMIIGPNGSGKSTVVAGICLGLGFEPKIMGRASHLNDTIKHGTQTANLEIELKGHPGTDNVIITRQFGHGEAGGKPTNEWHVDDRRSTHKNVMEIVRGFNCQIDNLCQFLPQDKVASFARMKPIEMLAETLRTIGDGELGALQNELIELQGKQKTETGSKKADAEKLKSLKERQDVLRRDVERFQERKEHQKAIDLRKMRLPFARYSKARDDVHIAREEYKAIKEEVFNLKKANQPLEVQEDSLSNAFLLSEKQATRCRTKVDATCRQLERQYYIPLKGAEAEMKKLEQRHKNERDAEKRNKQEIRALQEQVAHISHSLGPEPDGKDEIAELTERMQQINASQRKIQVEADTIEQRLDTKQTERDRIKKSLESKEKELSSLSDFRTQRIEVLRTRNPDAYTAVRWLKDNADKFEHRVFNPVVLEVQVTDKRYARAAQHVIMQNAFTFTCLSRADYTKFNDLLVDGTAAGKRLRLNVSEYSRTSAPTLRDQRSPLTKTEIGDFGFDGYLLDVLDGPDHILNTLCHAAQVHNLPVGTRELNQRDIDRIESAQRNNRPLFSRYILGETETKISRGYGQTSSISEGISNRGDVFSAASDPAKERALKVEIDELVESLNTDVEALRAEAGHLQELKAQRAQLDETKKEVHGKREGLNKKRHDWQKSTAQAKAKKEELERRLNAPVEYQDNIATIRAEQIEKTKFYTDLVLRYKADLLDCQAAYEKSLLAYSAQLQAQADKEAFDVHNAFIRETILLAEKTLDEKKRNRDNLTAHAKAIHKIAVDAVALLSEAERDAVNDFDPNSTPEDIEAEIEDYQTRLNILAETSGDVVGQYEARELEIAALQTAIDSREATVESLTNSIQERHATFDSQLETMRKAIDESFGEAFQSINCLGEIRIGKPVEYENWALEIWVQFRNEDPMALLTGECQSGGERAVSTIFYLMALQSLSIAPFRVVDEINQGMDARNERQVHSRMVQVACEINTSQYFLITPKLLSDLEYHQNMKVHCVTSGNLGRAGNRIGYPKYLAALRARKMATQQSQLVH